MKINLRLPLPLKKEKTIKDKKRESSRKSCREFKKEKKKLVERVR